MLIFVLYTTFNAYNNMNYFLKRQFDMIETVHIDNYRTISRNEKINTELLKKADFFIYEEIHERYKEYSTKHILSLLDKKCVYIQIPYVYNPVIWILALSDKVDYVVGNIVNSNDYINSEVIVKLKLKGYSYDEIVYMYRNFQIDFEFPKRIEDYKLYLEDVDSRNEIKIKDFILENISTHKLFNTHNRGSLKMYYHIFSEMMKIFDFEIIVDYSVTYNDTLFSTTVSHTFYDYNIWKYKFIHEEELLKNSEDYVKIIENIYFKSPNIFNISHTLPTYKIKPIDFTKKTKLFCPFIPGDRYISVPLEESYSESYISISYKKGGYDTFKHYEILANNSIPLILDINDIPETTMSRFPKEILVEAREKILRKDYNIKYLKNTITSLNTYVKDKLSCEMYAKNFLDIITQYKELQNKPPKILILNLNHSFIMCNILFGLRSMLGKNVVDYPRMDCMYDEKFAYPVGVLEDKNINRSKIELKLIKKHFDYVIIGPYGKDETPTEYDLQKYSWKEKVYIFSGERPYNIRHDNEYFSYLMEKQKEALCFVKELDNSTDPPITCSYEEFMNDSTADYKHNMTISRKILNKLTV